MAEDSYAGWQQYLIILRQATGVCPHNAHTYDAVGPPLGNLVQAEGIWFVKSTYVAPYDTFAHLAANRAAVASVIINLDTGEGRYYAGDHAGADLYWTFKQIAVGKVQEFSTGNERPVIKDRAIGEWSAQDLKSQQHDITFNFPKTWCPKRKITPARTSNEFNQYGFEGSGILEKISENPEAQDYYMIILYTADASSDATKVGQVKTFPCSKIDKLEIKAMNDDISRISFTGSSTYTFTYPDDEGKIENYSMV